MVGFGNWIFNMKKITKKDIIKCLKEKEESANKMLKELNEWHLRADLSLKLD